jgi:hypothetical protein
MLKERHFNIVRVSKDKGVGMDVIGSIDKGVTYKGKKVMIKL